MKCALAVSDEVNTPVASAMYSAPVSARNFFRFHAGVRLDLPAIDDQHAFVSS